MSLKTRVEKIEMQSFTNDKNRPGAIVICSVPVRLRADGSVNPRTKNDTQGIKPAVAYILKGPKAGQQVKSLDGETSEEFSVRVNRTVEGEE